MKHILSIILDKRFYAPIIIFIVTTILYKIIKKIILNIFSRKSKIMDEKKHNTLITQYINLLQRRICFVDNSIQSPSKKYL